MIRILAAISMVTCVACSSSHSFGPVYESFTIHQVKTIKDGITTDSEVRKEFGLPTEVVNGDGSKLFRYKNKEGCSILSLVIDDKTGLVIIHETCTTCNFPD